MSNRKSGLSWCRTASLITAACASVLTAEPDEQCCQACSVHATAVKHAPLLMKARSVTATTPRVMHRHPSERIDFTKQSQAPEYLPIVSPCKRDFTTSIGYKITQESAPATPPAVNTLDTDLSPLVISSYEVK